MILQCAARAARQSAETATARTRDHLHITNALHGAGNRAILVSSAGQQADGGRSGRKTAPQMPLRGRPSHRLSIRNMRVTWWSYGDSNSGPLACHQQATHPPQSITAGHRPAACTPVRPGPGRLRYFRAVLPRRSAGATDVAVLPVTVHSADRACHSANDKRADAGYGNGDRGTRQDVRSCSLRSLPGDGPPYPSGRK
jgi:hypothetical protein